MKYRVIKPFTCKLDMKVRRVGDIYETDDPERAKFLQDKGHLDETIVKEPVEDERGQGLEQEANQFDCIEMMKHVGGGYYEILVGANKGKRVKGKEIAEQELLAGLETENKAVADDEAVNDDEAGD